MNKPFYIIEPKVKKVPFILSVPHCGIDFPDEIVKDYIPEMIKSPDDTDWFVHQLYSFAAKMGITTIYAKYSRWVIDLNRDPKSLPLYDDGRIITALTPTSDFLGRNIYNSKDQLPNKNEVERRLNKYYWPYYDKVQSLLNDCKNEFGKALLWDAHSIRQFVPTIQKEKFPDMILGNNNETTANKLIINSALESLNSSHYGINHNTPFKGGHITRYFGKPKNNIHALQLEMNKILYMDDTETKFNEVRSRDVQSVLKQTFKNLIETLELL